MYSVDKAISNIQYAKWELMKITALHRLVPHDMSVFNLCWALNATSFFEPLNSLETSKSLLTLLFCTKPIANLVTLLKSLTPIILSR